ncbi:MAG: threonine dehydratase, partial [Gemmatimonadaceae bacterium]|nr:threonine dehydratase [Gemmatimonadaceae bacterium]
VGVAAILGGHLPSWEAPGVVVLSGGNIDQDRLDAIVLGAHEPHAGRPA